MAKKLIIFPFGGNAREALISILAINRIKKEWDVLGFIDDHPSMCGKQCCGVEVLGDKGVIKEIPDAYILAVPGNPNNYLERKQIIDNLNIENARFTTIIHPSVILAPDAQIGYNSILMPNVIVSCGVRIGNHCVILPNTVIAHDSFVGDYCCIGSNVSISGEVIIGPMCYIGSGAKVRECISIGGGSLIGLGANVISDIKEEVVAVGNPARVIREVKE